MNDSTALLFATLLALAPALSAAEEFTVADDAIANLGIEFVAPEVAGQVAIVEATARVVIPPTGDAIVSATQPGLLVNLDVAAGEAVVRGQLLARLESPDFIGLQREFLDALSTNLLAANDLARDRQLFEEGIISGRRLQETEMRAKIAATGLNEHRQLLRIAGLADPEIRALESTQALRRQLEIRAPFDGVILERMATAGERLDAMSPIYRLADLSQLWLEIDVPQEAVAAVRPGMKVAVADSAVALPAEVTTIGRSIDPATQTVVVRASIGEPDHGLHPGQFVVARVVAGQADGDFHAWIVPVSAVTQRGDRHYVFVRTSTGFDAREVRVLGSDPGRTTVAGEIALHDRIAVVGVATLKVLWSGQGETG